MSKFTTSVDRKGQLQRNPTLNESIRIKGIAYNMLIPKESATRKLKNSTKSLISLMCNKSGVIQMDSVRAEMYKDNAVRITDEEARNMNFEGGAINDSHGRKVGAVTDHWVKNSQLSISARVDDPETIEKIKSGKYRSFSVGYTINRDTNTDEVISKEFKEISVCENPIFEGCTFEVMCSKDSIDTVGGEAQTDVISLLSNKNTGYGSLTIDSVVKDDSKLEENKNLKYNNTKPTRFSNARNMQSEANQESSAPFQSESADTANNESNNPPMDSGSKEPHKDDGDNYDDIDMDDINTIRARLQKLSEIEEENRLLKERTSTYEQKENEKRAHYAKSTEPVLSQFKEFLGSYQGENGQLDPREEQVFDLLFSDDTYASTVEKFTKIMQDQSELKQTNKRMAESLDESQREVKRLKKQQQTAELADKYRAKRQQMGTTQRSSSSGAGSGNAKPQSALNATSQTQVKTKLSSLFNPPVMKSGGRTPSSNANQQNSKSNAKTLPLDIMASRESSHSLNPRLDVEVPTNMALLIAEMRQSGTDKHPFELNGSVRLFNEQAQQRPNFF